MANEYWTLRLANTTEVLYDKTYDETKGQLIKYYKQSFSSVERDMSDLWDALLAESETGEIKPNDLYKFNRYYELQNTLHDKLQALGQKEISLNGTKYQTMYHAVSKAITQGIPQQYVKQSFVVLPNDRVGQIIKQAWCADGKSWSERIWTNKAQLQQRIQDGLLDSVSRGIPKDKMVAQLQQDFGVGFNQADCIARTELSHVENTAASDSYKQAGIEQVKTIVSSDERLCGECSSHDGEIHSVDDAGPGTAYLFHPMCRCTFIAVVT